MWRILYYGVRLPIWLTYVILLSGVSLLFLIWISIATANVTDFDSEVRFLKGKWYQALTWKEASKSKSIYYGRD